jgi:RNA polymerase sigma factor (sigma-70 family)
MGHDIDVEQIIDEQSEALVAQAVLGERDQLLRAALMRLTSRERLLLALRYEDDLSASRIASIIGVSTPFHVYRQLNNVLQRLRVMLEASGVEGVDG